MLLLLATGIFPDIVLRPFRPRIVLWTEIYTSVLRPLSADAEELVARIEEVAGEIRGSRGRVMRLELDFVYFENPGVLIDQGSSVTCSIGNFIQEACGLA